jgi:hypothetical protein
MIKHSYTMFNALWRNECQYHGLLPPTAELDAEKIATCFSFPMTKNPIHWLSDEKKGADAPSVPGMALTSRLSMARR